MILRPVVVLWPIIVLRSILILSLVGLSIKRVGKGKKLLRKWIRNEWVWLKVLGSVLLRAAEDTLLLLWTKRLLLIAEKIGKTKLGELGMSHFEQRNSNNNKRANLPEQHFY